MDAAELEGMAIEAHGRAKLDPAEPTNVFTLARKLDRKLTVEVGGTIGGRLAQLSWVNGQPRIALCRRLPNEVIQHPFAHELAHMLLGKYDHLDPEVERDCDILAGALIACRPAVLALYRAHGMNLRRIARAAVSTQTWAALRLGECLTMPLATVSPGIVRVRGPEGWVWPAEEQIRSWQRRPGPGIRRIAVTDRPKRAVFLADSMAA